MTERDVILQKYYITKRRKSVIYKETHKYEQYKRFSRVATRNLES